MAAPIKGSPCWSVTFQEIEALVACEYTRVLSINSKAKPYNPAFGVVVFEIIV
jgi:hypothetical protein